MKNSTENRKILEEIERRKKAKENPCNECGGSGHSSFSTDGKTLACSRCLGRGVLLTDDEHRLLMEMVLTGYNDEDSILDAAEIH